MGKNLSATVYRRRNNIYGGFKRVLPDLTETARPRYQMGHTLTHRRGEKRMEKWLKYI